MTLDAFEILVNEAYRSLPAKVKKILERKEVKILVREKVPEAVMQHHPGKIVFGVFAGLPYGRAGMYLQYEPTRIEIYKESFEKVFVGEEEIRRNVAKTVMHEVAHYLGFSESYLKKLGY